MKTKLMTVFCLCLVFSFISCQQQKNQDQVLKAKQEAGNIKNYVNDSAFSMRPFIVNSSLKTSVENCNKTSDSVEKFIYDHKGFVLLSNTLKNVTKSIKNDISADSSKLIEYYQPFTELTARIPVVSISRFLQYVQSLSNDIELRKIEATDESFDIQLHKRTIASKDIPESDPTTTKTDFNEYVTELDKLKDATELATIQLTLQEPERVQIKHIVNSKNEWQHEASFWSQAKTSLQKGFYWLLKLVVFILQFWWLIPSYYIAIFLYKKLSYKLPFKIDSK